MPQVKVANPASALMLVNGGRKMRKRKAASTRRHKKANPRHRRVTVRVNGRRGHKHVARRRRRNPGPFAGMGLFKDAAYAALGGAGTLAVRSMIPISFGGGLGEAAIIGGVAYGLGLVGEKLLSKEAGKMIAIGGFTIAVNSGLNAVGINLQSILSPSPKPAVKAVGSGVGDIGVFPRGTYDPYYGSTPNLSGVGDIRTMAR